MTQDEVDKIYEYLHDNYEYRGGELIIAKLISNKKIGETVGTIQTSKTGKTKINCCLSINGFRFFLSLGQLIWIYFNKKYEKTIGHIDNNTINNNIENLYKSSFYDTNIKSYNDYRIYKGEKKGYQVRIGINGKSLYLGVYDTKEKAKFVNEKAMFLRERGISASEIKNKLIKDGIYKPRKSKIFKGVYKNHNNYMAQISLNGKKKYLGSFPSEQEAHEAYLKAKEQHANP